MVGLLASVLEPIVAELSGLGRRFSIAYFSSAALRKTPCANLP